MRPYIALFGIRFANSLQYRAAAIAGIVTQFAWGFMYILAFMAFYESNPAAFPMTLQQTVSYFWMQQAFMAVFFIWFYDMSVFEQIESGAVAYELVRPIDLYNKWFTSTAANRLARAALRCSPILIVALLLPYPFRLVLPNDFTQLIMFFVSLFLTLGVVVSLNLLLYASAFYTINSSGTRIVVAITSDFLSGGYIPIPFFPDVIRSIVELSPFGAMQNTPLLIFGGYLTGDALVRGISIQVFWLIVLVLLGKVLMQNAVKRVVVQGG